jgi:hypothetical protein
MKAEYDLSKLKSRKNPYASKLKKPVTTRLPEDKVAYFKHMANKAGVCPTKPSTLAAPDRDATPGRC